MIKMQRRTLALGMAMTLLLSTSALAASAEERREDVGALYDALSQDHPNLFANTSQEVFLSRKAELERGPADSSELDFALQLQSLVALVGDSHTSINIGAAGDDVHILPMSLSSYEGAWVLSTLPAEHQQWLGSRVTAVNGMPMETFVDAFRPIVSADNDVWFSRQFQQLCYVQEILEWLKLTEPGAPLKLSVTSPKGTQGELSLSALSAEEQKTPKFSTLKETRTAAPATEYDKKQFYFAQPLDDSTYYIQYNRCQNDPDHPMKDFAAQVQADLDKKPYTKVILDLRNNGGGSDGVISPLLSVLSQARTAQNRKVFCLIGERTFSSAVINAVMLKELGAGLVGTPSGGSVDHFGAVNSFSLPNSGLKVGHSTKFIDMETLLAAGAGYGVEALRPDWSAPQTLSDYLSGKDTAVEAILKGGDTWTAPENAPMLQTRGGFIERLWSLVKEAGAEITAPGESSFQDVFPFASYCPALSWAQDTGLMLGDGRGMAYPARAMTETERGLVLERFQTWAGGRLTAEQTEEIVSALSA